MSGYSESYFNLILKNPGKERPQLVMRPFNFELDTSMDFLLYVLSERRIETRTIVVPPGDDPGDSAEAIHTGAIKVPEFVAHHAFAVLNEESLM